MRRCEMPVEVRLAFPLFDENEMARVGQVAIDLVADAAFLAQRGVHDASEELFEFVFETGFGGEDGDNGQGHGGSWKVGFGQDYHEGLCWPILQYYQPVEIPGTAMWRLVESLPDTQHAYPYVECHADGSRDAPSRSNQIESDSGAAQSARDQACNDCSEDGARALFRHFLFLRLDVRLWCLQTCLNGFLSTPRHAGVIIEPSRRWTLYSSVLPPKTTLLKMLRQVEGTQHWTIQLLGPLSTQSRRSLTLFFEDERLKVLQEMSALISLPCSVGCLCFVQ
jgi:hypothetical protein